MPEARRGVVYDDFRALVVAHVPVWAAYASFQMLGIMAMVKHLRFVIGLDHQVVGF